MPSNLESIYSNRGPVRTMGVSGGFIIPLVDRDPREGKLARWVSPVAPLEFSVLSLTITSDVTVSRLAAWTPLALCRPLGSTALSAVAKRPRSS